MHKKAHPFVRKDGSVESGMDLRDYFACGALQALIGKENSMEDKELAKRAFEIADTMVNERYSSRVKTKVEF